MKEGEVGYVKFYVSTRKRPVKRSLQRSPLYDAIEQTFGKPDKVITVRTDNIRNKSVINFMIQIRHVMRYRGYRVATRKNREGSIIVWATERIEKKPKYHERKR